MAKKNSREVDVLIVGAGIMGSLAAFYLHQTNPNLRIGLIDKTLVGSETSYYSLGLVYPYGATIQKQEMTHESFLLWEELLKQFEFDIKPLSFEMVPGAQEVPGTESSVVVSGTCQARAWHVQAFQANTHQVVVSLCQYLRQQKNILIYEGIEVRLFELEKDQQIYRILTSTSGSTSALTDTNFSSQKILLALGPWITSFLDPKWVEFFKLKTKKIVSFHIDIKPEKNDSLLYLRDERAFLIPNHFQNIWQLSITSDVWNVKPDINQLFLDAEDEARGLQILKKYRPAWLSAYRGGRVFCDSYNAESTPLVAMLPDNPNIVIATAGSGIGFRLAPSIAKKAVQLLIES